MDEFIDQFFSPSSWTDDNVSETSSWIGNGLDQTNEILVDTMGAYAGDEKNLPASLVPSCHIVDSLIAEDTSMFVGGDSGFDVDKSLIPGESQALQGGMDYGSKPTYVMDGDVKPGYRDQQLITLDYDSPELVPVAIDPTKSPSVQPESGSVGSNDSEPSESHPTPRDSDSLTSIPPLWPPSSYRSVSSLPPVAVQDKVQGLGLQGQYVQTDAAVLGNNNFMDDINLQCNLPALLSVNGQHDLNNHYLSSFAAGHLIPVGRTSAIHPQMQLSEGNSIKHYADQSPISQQLHMPATAAGGCNGTAKPRVRARRGQATDPHSIAERLRREKIAERMKNLQELVPNSNKTDKASMLDEIIEYVKFLQLQVLSMSRLGAPGAVVPLITDSHAEGSTGLFLPQSGSRGVDSFESPDDLEFEQEVVKLMESSMTTAIQFLQSKGLCLMPLALASAISGSKASFGSMSADRKKPVLSNGNGQASVETGQVPSGGDTKPKENVIREDIPINRCNGDHMQKEVMNTARNTREMNPHEA